MAFVEFEPPRNLRRPAMIAAFGGWSDGSESATTAALWLKDRLDARRFATIDPEEFYDFQVHRPIVRLVDGVYRTLDWPANEFFHASLPERDLVILAGLEPNLKWRTFTGLIVDLAGQLDVEILVTLGAFLADVPHTVDIPIMGTAADLEQAGRLGLATSRYQGSTGIVGALQIAARNAALPAASLWAAVPHYLRQLTNPKAALALVERASTLLGVTVDTHTLTEAQANWERQVTEVIAEDPRLASLVEMLETRIGSIEGNGEIEVPTGDQLAEELERFLRDERGEG